MLCVCCQPACNFQRLPVRGGLRGRQQLRSMCGELLLSRWLRQLLRPVSQRHVLARGLVGLVAVRVPGQLDLQRQQLRVRRRVLPAGQRYSAIGRLAVCAVCQGQRVCGRKPDPLRRGLVRVGGRAVRVLQLQRRVVFAVQRERVSLVRAGGVCRVGRARGVRGVRCGDVLEHDRGERVR